MGLKDWAKGGGPTPAFAKAIADGKKDKFEAVKGHGSMIEVRDQNGKVFTTVFSWAEADKLVKKMNK